MVPVSRTMGVLANLETFERQAAKVSSESRPAKTAQEKESKEAREKREKMERLLKKDRRGGSRPKIFRSPDLAEAGKGLAPADRQKEIDERYPGGCRKWPMAEACSPYTPTTP